MPDAITLESPFFIVGCGRSGTTLLRRMIDAHPLLAVPVESLFMIDYLRARDHIADVPYKRLILGEHEFSEWELSASESDLADCKSVVEVINDLHERYAAKEKAQFWGQKTPRFVRYGHLLKAVYPHAKFIHVIRDPRAVAISLRKSNVHRSNVYFGAQRWQKDVQAGLDLKRDFPNDVMEVSYETLVSETELTLREICDFLGIPFDEAMLSWPAGPRESDGNWAPYWYASVEQSTGFMPPLAEPAPVPPELQPLVDACMPLYDTMREYALR